MKNLKNKLLKISLLITSFGSLSSKVFAKTFELAPIEGSGRWSETGGDASIKNLEKIFSTVIGFLTIFAGLYFMVSFLIGAIGWTTAGGETDKIETAKKRMTNGAIGLIIVVAAYSIIFIIGEVLGLDILNLAETFDKLVGGGGTTPPSNPGPFRPQVPI